MMPVGEELREEEAHVQEHDHKKSHSLRECARNAVEAYFLHLDGHMPSGLYKMVLDEVEIPLLEVVLRQARGNYSHAADLLGINRTTLRKKLKRHQLTL
uniref:Putative Fis-like DNA-binding protein n=1 Tax=Candidatus Kentrum sp. LPFa TaxID=2126335 RepID=A0A450WUQ2_9GAMM|nr:MAG: Fis family transcriptional regulator, factor for inversion stimulation protein [Candidatus Kentron sp. LPFa]VFK20730.1 MAG: Fis family transcriptional regulator, factor for inversion stimulation protein [Candidatus Kentron sp. LPFa]VFK34797.1 MAG: Fis family transcriptional regulator, factor for inversion stimulation protein [Candidatus Kentron sp. LPFa]